jgi:hypothetical protein
MWRTVLVLTVWFALGQPDLCAQEKVDPGQIVLGVARLALNSEYVGVSVNGEAWEDLYFTDDGRVLIVENLNRTKEVILVLTPIYAEFRPEEVHLHPKDWKLAKLDKITRQWRCEKSVTFRKWKPGEKEALEVKPPQGPAGPALPDVEEPAPAPADPPPAPETSAPPVEAVPDAQPAPTIEAAPDQKSASPGTPENDPEAAVEMEIKPETEAE